MALEEILVLAYTYQNLNFPVISISFDLQSKIILNTSCICFRRCEKIKSLDKWYQKKKNYFYLSQQSNKILCENKQCADATP